MAECSIQLEFQFHQYSNPSGNKYNQNCCDQPSFCISACDTVFSRICLGPGGSTENCPWSEHMLTPGAVGENSIQFTDSIGAIGNPFSITVASQVIHSTFTSSYNIESYMHYPWAMPSWPLAVRASSLPCSQTIYTFLCS